MERPAAEILEKVKKLLALGTSPSEAEAASALEKARVLLARHGLSLADVDASRSDVSEEVLFEKKRLRAWESDLILVVSRCTFTRALHLRRGPVGQILLIGREVNTRSAQDLFSYLHLAILKLARAHSGGEVHLESFRRGVVHRVGERLALLNKDKDESAGVWAGSQGDPFPSESSDRQLVLQMDRTAEKENRDYISDKYGKTKEKHVGRRVEVESYQRGRAAGEGVSLNRQIGSGGKGG